MAQIKVEDVVYHLDREFTKALEDTMLQFAPEASFDRSELFKFFLRRVYAHCSIWEHVPENSVK